MPDRPRIGRGPLIAAAALVAVLLAALGVYSASSSSGSTVAADYRTATVARGPVAQVLTLTGTAQLTDQVIAVFPASGTVTRVNVKIGDHVSAGQTIATIDPTALRARLLTARASLAQDEASLVADQSATSSAPTATSGAGASTASSSSSRQSTSAGSSGGSGTASQLGTDGASAGHAKVRSSAPKLSLSAAQRALAAAQAALTAEEQACAPVLGTHSLSPGAPPVRTPSGTPTGTGGGPTLSPSQSPQPTVSAPTPLATSTPVPTSQQPTPSVTTTAASIPSGTPTPTASETNPPTSGGVTTPSVDELRACAAAMRSVADAQHAAGRALATVAAQVARELTVIAQAASAPASGSSGAGQAAATSAKAGSPSTPTTSSSAARTAGGAGAAGGTGSAARAASDEVAILQDQAAVTQAEADLAGATLKAPIAGTVGQIGLTVGQSATASQGIVIVGTGSATVTVTVPLADMGLVRAGLPAAITPAGDVTSVPGTLESVNLLPVSASATSPSYPATVVVPSPTGSMASGSIVSVSITVGRAADAVRLPVSALSGLRSGTGEVRLLEGGATRTTAVTVGAVGGGYAQVLTGLAVGDRVVLADAAAALPANQTVGVRGLGGGRGFGAGGAGGVATSRPGG